MTSARQAKRGGLLIGLIVAIVAVGILSAAMVKSLRGQAVTSIRTYNLMRARYAADSGNNYFSSLPGTNQWGYADQGDVTYTLGNKDQFVISASSNATASATNLLVKITGRRMDGDKVLAVRVLTREQPLGLTSGQQTNGVSTEIYSTTDFIDAKPSGSAQWEVSDDGDGPTFYNANTDNKTAGGLLFDHIYTNFTLSVKATLIDGKGYGLYYLARYDPVDTDRIDGYCFQFDSGAGNRFRIYSVRNTYGETKIADVKMKDIFGNNFDVYNIPHDISITVSNNFHTITVDDTPVFDFLVQVDGASRTIEPENEVPKVSYNSPYTVDDDKDESGRVGFRVWSGAGGPEVEFTDLTVTTGNATVELEGDDVITGF